jgi:hypothetical protein
MLIVTGEEHRIRALCTDLFSWMIVSFCGIGMMWFILFAAIKASGTIGESVGKSVETF